MQRKYHEIDDTIKITFDVPSILQELMDAAEIADEKDDGSYFMLADDIDICSKNCCAAGLISEAQWNLIIRRYKQW